MAQAPISSSPISFPDLSYPYNTPLYLCQKPNLINPKKPHPPWMAKLSNGSSIFNFAIILDQTIFLFLKNYIIIILNWKKITLIEEGSKDSVNKSSLFFF